MLLSSWVLGSTNYDLCNHASLHSSWYLSTDFDDLSYSLQIYQMFGWQESWPRTRMASEPRQRSSLSMREDAIKSTVDSTRLNPSRTACNSDRQRFQWPGDVQAIKGAQPGISCDERARHFVLFAASGILVQPSLTCLSMDYLMTILTAFLTKADYLR